MKRWLSLLALVPQLALADEGTRLELAGGALVGVPEGTGASATGSILQLFSRVGLELGYSCVVHSELNTSNVRFGANADWESRYNDLVDGFRLSAGIAIITEERVDENGMEAPSDHGGGAYTTPAAWLSKQFGPIAVGAQLAAPVGWGIVRRHYDSTIGASTLGLELRLVIQLR